MCIVSYIEIRSNYGVYIHLLLDEVYKNSYQKKRKKKNGSTKIMESFPVDLLMEILLRVPARPLVRFRCVYKF